jgi:hypothetical protein
MLLNKNSRKIFLALILIIFAFSLVIHYNLTTKVQWKEAVNFIGSQRDSEKGVIFLEIGNNIFLTDIYYKGNMSIVPLYESQDYSALELKENLNGKDYFWLALSRNWKRDDYYKAVLESMYGKPEIQKEFFDIKVYLYNTK